MTAAVTAAMLEDPGAGRWEVHLSRRVPLSELSALGETLEAQGYAVDWVSGPWVTEVIVTENTATNGGD